MFEFKDNLRKVECLLRYDQAKENSENCKNLYDFLGVGSTADAEEIKSAIKKKYSFYQPKQNVTGWETVASEFIKSRSAIESILCENDNRQKYDNQLTNLKVKELLKHFMSRTRSDKELDSKEKSELIEEGKEIGLSETQIIEVINEWIKKYKVKEVEFHPSAPTSSSIPYDVLLNKTYYEILGVSEDADYAEIKKVYDDEHKKYINARDKAKANARWFLVSEAWECLRDNNKRRKYDEEQRRKRDKDLTSKGDPKLEIVDESGKEKRKYEFKDMRLRTTQSVTVTAKNGGGGTLDARIKTSDPWLIVDTDKIHQSNLPQEITITVDPKTDPGRNVFGGNGAGFIEINYKKGSYAESEKIYVNFNIEMDVAALTRFKRGVTFGGLVLGFVFGLQIFNFFIGATFDHTFLIALILITIVGSKSGYKVAGGGGAFGWGLGIFVGGLIFLLILQKWFPHAFSAVAWALIYGSIANISSTSIRRGLWQGKYQVPIGVGIGTIALTLMLIIVGVEGERQKRNAESARSKGMQNAIQTISKRLSGDWEGEVNSKRAKLTIFQNGKAYIVYSNIKEFLSLSEFDLAHEKFVLKGTSYENLGSPEKTSFSLDTFHGQLSKDGRTISGNFVDTAGNKGNWSVTKHVYTETPANTKTVTQRSMDGAEKKEEKFVQKNTISKEIKEEFKKEKESSNHETEPEEVKENKISDISNLIIGQWKDEDSGKEYFKDGTFITNAHTGEKYTGTWSVINNTLRLQFLTPQPILNVYTIIELTDSTLKTKLNGFDGRTYNSIRIKPFHTAENEYKKDDKDLEESGKVTKGETNQTKVKTTLNPNSLFASRNSRIYHKSNCLELNAGDLIEFASSQKAQEAGGLPCEYCNSSTFSRRDTINVGNSNIFAITNHVKDSNKFDIHYRTFPSTFQETWYGVIQQLNIQKEKGIQQRKDKGIITDLTRHGIYPQYDKYYIVIEQMNYSTTKVSLKLFTYYREMKEKNFAEIVQNIKDNKDISLLPEENRVYMNKRAKKFLDNISKILAKNY